MRLMTTKKTIIPIEVRVTMGMVLILEHVCKTGLPENIQPELREVIQEFICVAINPIRPLPHVDY